MKLTCCSKCGNVIQTNKTCIIDGLRICHDCKKKSNSLQFYKIRKMEQSGAK
jgi:RNA polymerase-binding transcription factor DksA